VAESEQRALLALLRAASYLEMEVWVRARVKVRASSSIARGLEVSNPNQG